MLQERIGDMSHTENVSIARNIALESGRSQVDFVSRCRNTITILMHRATPSA